MSVWWPTRAQVFLSCSMGDGKWWAGPQSNGPAGILDGTLPGVSNLSGFAAPFLYNSTACFHGITNHGGGVDGLGTPDVGCLSKA